MVFGENAAAITQMKPITDEVRMAVAGTPRRVTATNCGGASRRAARTNSIRDAVYMPEFRQLSTAVSTTAFMMWSAYGMPHLGERRDERRRGDLVAVPRQDRHQQERGPDEEHRDAQDHRVGGLGHRPFGIRGFRGRDGRDLGADHREDHCHHTDRDGHRAHREEAAVRRTGSRNPCPCAATARSRTAHQGR